MLLGRFLTVRRGLTFIILLLAGLIQALMVVVLISSLDKRNAGRELTRTNEIGGLLSSAAHQWSLERSRIAIALATERPADAAVLQALAEARRAGAEVLEQARQVLAESPDLRHKASLFSEIDAAMERIGPLRRTSDSALMKARPERNLQLTNIWSGSLTLLIDRSDELIRRLLAIGEDLEPAASLVRLQAALRTVEELAWREQAILGAARAAGREVTAPVRERLGQIRGRQEEAWQSAEAIAAHLANRKLAAAIEAAGTGYFGSSQSERPGLQATARDALGQGPAWDPWSRDTVAALDSLRAAQNAANLATGRAAAELTEVSEGAIVLGYILLGGAMLGSAFALAIIHFGLYRPLTRLVEAAGRLAQIDQLADSALEIPSHRRQDELGALARTLGALQARLGYKPAG